MTQEQTAFVVAVAVVFAVMGAAFFTVHFVSEGPRAKRLNTGSLSLALSWVFAVGAAGWAFLAWWLQ